MTDAQAPATPTGTRLVLVSDGLLEVFGTRNERGDRLTFEWGEPDEHGWYSPAITEHRDDNLLADAGRRLLEARIAGYREGRAAVWDELREYVEENAAVAASVLAAPPTPAPAGEETAR